MLRIGICDDAADARMALRTAVSRALDARGVQHMVYEFSSGEGVTAWHEKHAGELDLLFLDIEMGGMDGMQTARVLRAADTGLGLIFVTGYADYVFDGYAVGALGYLMKPPKPAQLEEALTRALGQVYLEERRAFLCRNAEGLYRIPRTDIHYFFSDKRQVTCVTDRRQYSFYGKLDEVQRELGDGFVRIHQRYLVRAAAVERVEGSASVVLQGEMLPISRACAQSALAALTRAMLD